MEHKEMSHDRKQFVINHESFGTCITEQNGKSKFFPAHAMEAYRQSRCPATLVLKSALDQSKSSTSYFASLPPLKATNR
jgi:hypothetical protein